MKLMCTVEVSNRLCEGNIKRKPKKSCLSIGKLKSTENDLYLLLQTMENKQGVKYKVKTIRAYYFSFLLQLLFDFKFTCYSTSNLLIEFEFNFRIN